MSVFVRPREEVSVKIVLTLPEECNLGELMATMVDVVTMGGQKLRHQKVFVFGRAEVFTVCFSNQIYSEEHKVKVVPLVLRSSSHSGEVIEKYKVSLTNQNIYSGAELRLIPLKTPKEEDSLSESVEIIVAPNTLSIGAGMTQQVQIYLRMKKQRGEVKEGKVIKAVVCLSPSTSLVYGLYLEIQIIKSE